MKCDLSKHARREMSRRDIGEEVVKSVLEYPEQIVPEKGGKKAYQSRVVLDGKTFLVRVIVAEDVDPLLAVTVYRTSKIEKYWR